MVAACWLTAGPGAELLRAAVACQDAGMHMAMGHSANTPAGPCFCAQMVGSFDQTLSVAMPTLSLPAVTPEPAVRWVSSVPLSPSRSWTFAPQTRPPIAA